MGNRACHPRLEAEDTVAVIIVAIIGTIIGTALGFVIMLNVCISVLNEGV
jgi:hypothetical protein